MKLLAVFCLLVTALGPASDVTASPQTPTKPCIQYWGEARYVIGYNHIVHIVNGCTRDAACVVSTDFNPNQQSVSVPAGSHVTVVTYLGAPTGRFVPYVRCTLDNQRVED